MIFKRIVIIVFLLYLQFGFYHAPVDAQTELSTILAGASIGDMMITSGSGNLVYEYTRVDSLSARAQQKDQEHIAGTAPEVKTVIRNHETIDISFSFSGMKVRCDESSYNRLPTGTSFSQDWQWAYNGEKVDILQYDGVGENGLIIPRGSIRADYAPRINRFDPKYNGLTILGTSTGEFLKGTFAGNTVENLKAIRQETLDTVNCVVVSGNVVNTGDTITAWLAPGIMFRPKRIEYRSGDELTIVNNHFKEYSGGVWFPETISKALFYQDSKGQWVCYTKEKISVLKDFTINIDLPASLFEVQFPVGLWVYDYRFGEKVEIK